MTAPLRGAQLGLGGSLPRKGGAPLQELPAAQKPLREALVWL